MIKEVIIIKRIYILLLLLVTFVFGSGFSKNEINIGNITNFNQTRNIIHFGNNANENDGLLLLTNEGGTFDDIGYQNMDCYGLLGMPDNPDNPAYWLQLALQVIRYAGIAALVIMSTIDFIQAITKQDSDALKAAINKSVRRFIFAVILFFVPLIVSTIMDLFGVYGTCTL